MAARTMNSSPSSPSEGVAEADFSLPLAVLNRRLAQSRDNPNRVHEGTFKVPDGISERGFEQMVKAAGQSFIYRMEQKRWTLRSRLKLLGPFNSLDLYSGALLLSEHEYRFRGVFATVPKTVRIEVPAGLVQSDPQHHITEREAVKALGQSPVRSPRQGR